MAGSTSLRPAALPRTSITDRAAGEVCGLPWSEGIDARFWQGTTHRAPVGNRLHGRFRAGGGGPGGWPATCVRVFTRSLLGLHALCLRLSGDDGSAGHVMRSQQRGLDLTADLTFIQGLVRVPPYKASRRTAEHRVLTRPRHPRRRARWCRGPAGRQWRSKMTATLKMTHKAIGVEVRRGTYDIVVDGQRAGSLEMNDTIEIPVEPGRHTLQIRSGRNSSRTQTFEAAEGQTVAFRCTGKSFLPIFLASFVVPSLALQLHSEA